MDNSIKELTLNAYNERQQFEITEPALKARAAKLHSTDKFKWSDGAWEKMPYIGYAIVSMLDANFGNGLISRKLVEMQQFFLKEVEDAQRHFFPLPAASFHQTVANTLSSHRFKMHIQEKGLEPEYPQMIANAFAQIPPPTATEPIAMQLIGISIFGSALGILGTFEKAQDFDRILNFRAHIYTNPVLNMVDIKRTRPFIGHLTMIYIDGVLTDKQKAQLVQACVQLNKAIEKQPLVFSIQQTALRHYKDLSYFQTQPNYPTYHFVPSSSPNPYV